jgi:hypothetical protein
MTCKRVTTLTLVLAAALAGCGNYSNEDLEYMNAVPDRDDLAASMPQSKLMNMDEEAELSKVTHDAITTSNDLLDLFLGIVDAVRKYQPTSRTPNSRSWGPVPAVREIGWQWRFIVIRDAPTMFTYRLEFQRIGDPSDRWAPLLTGWFEPSPSSGARRGVGGFLVQTSELRIAGYPFENRGDLLASIDVTYSTREFPVSVALGIAQFIDDGTYANTNTLRYEYATQEDGRGAMRFELSGAALIGEPTSMVDTLLVTTRWLPSGAGRGEATVTQGDWVPGQVQVQCWGSDFRQTYNDKPWNMIENYGGDASVCPEIPTL